MGRLGFIGVAGLIIVLVCALPAALIGTERSEDRRLDIVRRR